jgi:probable HAF family extracellular repeat protein
MLGTRAQFPLVFLVFVCRFLSVSALVLMCVSAAEAQSQASCTFKSFGLEVNLPDLGTMPWSPAGINDFETIVGSVSTPAADFGIIRWSGGGLTSVFATSLVDRNDSGITIGFSPIENNQPILMTGTTVDLLTLNNQAQFTVSSINNWGSIVGTYFTDFPNGLTGFKRWSNGGFITLSFPGAQQTTPMGINDKGTVVGVYAAGSSNGFIYHNGEWATLNFPKSANTSLVGISNAGMIVGSAVMSDGSQTAFLYENGVFKTISPEGATPNSTTVFGISPKLGLIVGTAKGLSQGGFIAKCQ